MIMHDWHCSIDCYVQKMLDTEVVGTAEEDTEVGIEEPVQGTC